MYLNSINPEALLTLRLLRQMIQLVKSRRDQGLVLDDLLVLLVHFYAVDGERQRLAADADLEDRLRSVLAEAFVADADVLSSPLQQFGRSAKSLTCFWFGFYFHEKLFPGCHGNVTSDWPSNGLLDSNVGKNDLFLIKIK